MWNRIFPFSRGCQRNEKREIVDRMKTKVNVDVSIVSTYQVFAR